MARDRITRSFKLEKFPAGHMLFKEGDFIRSAHLVKRGEVELYTNRNLKFIQMMEENAGDEAGGLNELKVIQDVIN